MKFINKFGASRRADPAHEGHDDNHHHHHRSRRGGRLFDYGDLRLLILAMIAAEPRHGYELIKAIEERFGGAYSPSPGVIYPTLAWLADMEYASVEKIEGGRKSYLITAEGEAFLAANRAQADALLTRASPAGGRGDVPAPILRAMENLKLALRLRIRKGAITDAGAQTIAEAIDAAAKITEQNE